MKLVKEQVIEKVWNEVSGDVREKVSKQTRSLALVQVNNPVYNRIWDNICGKVQQQYQVSEFIDKFWMKENEIG